MSEYRLLLGSCFYLCSHFSLSVFIELGSVLERDLLFVILAPLSLSAVGQACAVNGGPGGEDSIVGCTLSDHVMDELGGVLAHKV